ncbi:lysozyme [Pectobacterium carotovorum]|uniref:lysozyme n=1 Tax=Pectobacterium carotovorum TaxID=554 RepID=UPI003823A203
MASLKTKLSAAMLALIAAGASAPVLLDQFLIEKEGFRLVAYKDGVGIWTICDGLTTYQGRKIVAGMRLTAEQCRTESSRRHKEALSWLQRNINPAVYVTLTEPQKVGVASFCYWNLGPGKCTTKTTFWPRLNAGDKKGACESIKWWIKDQGRDCRIRSNNCYGQVERRDQESELTCWGLDG